MRILLLTLFIISFISVRAQSQLPLSDINFSQRNAINNYNSLNDSNNVHKKWTLTKYGGISAGYGYFNGGNASFFSAPIGLQLNRRLHNNLYAFAAISAAPAYINFNRSFINADINKMNSGLTRYSSNGFTMYSKFEAGLMYENDDKTFSISGSIGVYNGINPRYPVYNGPNLQNQPATYNSRQ
jgi:hypothetical protein